MSNIEQLGWNEEFEESLSDDDRRAGSQPARVVSENRRGIVVDDGTHERSVSSQGRWFHGSEDQRPIVGDWVLLSARGDSVVRVLDRKNKLQRISKRSGSPQAIASNIDIMFIVFSCDAAFNESRLERYLALGETSGVGLAIVLTKIDLCSDYARYIERANRVTFGIPIIPVNALERSFLDEIISSFTGALTSIFVGASGVGKSTLINTMVGSQVQDTREVRTRDSKGRHTTTARNLIRLPFGGLAVDVPGTRELQLASRPPHLPQSFPDIEEAIQNCRFASCRHTSEPGCAIQKALETGEFDERRLRNYLSIVG
ncbi:MAG: ribosome small subunit-dependent GTPase A [Gammaproteobacteria bacterium]|nr:ribosome small subunit-dependent GTPase A [Gammaproteobacteria bacterium]MYD80787.1 ribosome small subunit-dependent GTPase A [Gammaproteobacteria bacterium]